MFIDGKKLKSA